ncbi:hypothetical protein FRC00_003141, partial [Tulasnella sp. 408]
MPKLSKKDQKKLERQCERTVICLPDQGQAPLTEEIVIKSLGVTHAVVLRDDQSGGYWVRGSADEFTLFFDRLHKIGLPGYTTRQIERNEEQWGRLFGKLASILRNGSKPSQQHTSVEQQQDAPSTSRSYQLRVSENLESGNGGTSASSLGLGGSIPDSDSGSDGSGHASANPPSDKRPRKKRRLDREVSPVDFSSPTTNSTHKESAPPLDTTGAPLPETSSTHEQSAPFLDTAGVSLPGTSSAHAQSAPPLDTAGVPSPETSSTHAQFAPPLDTAGVPPSETSSTNAQPTPPLDAAGTPPPETSSTLEQSAPSLDTVGILPPGTSSTHAQSPPPLDAAGTPPPETSSTLEQSAQALDTDDVPPPGTSSTYANLPPSLLNIFLSKLSPELIAVIFERCFDDVSSFKEHNSVLETLASHGGRCFQILEGMSSLWTKITSLSSKTHIEVALKLSQQRPLHIQGGPDVYLTAAANFGHLSHFLIHVKPHRDRWASFSLVFPSRMMKKVQKCLANPAPGLQMLSLCMADTALNTNDAFPVGAVAPTEETDRSLNILGGEAGNLQRLFLNNIPCLWDPSSFTEIAELGLTNGIEVRYMDLISFFRRACNLHTLRLVNIKLVGDAPHVVEET